MAQEPGFPVWKGLFDWSIQFQDGTHPSNFSPEEFTPERRAWLEAALKHYMADFVDRMSQIKKTLDEAATGGGQSDVAAGGADQGQAGRGAAYTLEEQENLLDELVDIVSSIDYARDLHKIGGLPTLLELLQSRHASLRARAAEVLATCMANNPPVQQWFLEGGVLTPLLSLLGGDSSALVRTKALLALSAMVRHSTPCLDAFKTAGGMTLLVAAINSQSDVRLVRKALFLLHYLLATSPADGDAACQLGALPAIAGVLHDFERDGQGAAAGADGADVGNGGGGTDLRQAVLSVLAAIASTARGWQDVQEFAVPPAADGAHHRAADTSAAATSEPPSSAPSSSQGPPPPAASTGSYFVQAVQRLLTRHQALSAEERESEQEEEALCLQLLKQLSSGPPSAAPVPAAASASTPTVAPSVPQPMLMLGAP